MSPLTVARSLLPVASGYRGRFAPSPTGPLHFGSLIAAVGSYLQARQANGAWMVRIEDLDPPRTVPGSADAILRTLEAFGFEWDEAVVHQSQRYSFYERALAQLRLEQRTFLCSCSRSNLATPDSGPIGRYSGTCRAKPAAPDQPLATRLRVDPGIVRFMDRIQGLITTDVTAQVGDFVLKRRDGLWAYQLAVVVDDAAQAITEVVRGADLLDTVPRQILLQRALGLPMPEYVHLPLAMDTEGKKFSKSTGALALNPQTPGPALWAALQFLKQSPPQDLRDCSVAQIWTWARDHWSLLPLAGLSALPAPNSH